MLHSRHLIVTIGPSTQTSEMLDKIASFGFVKARLNTSHSDVSWHLEVGQKLKRRGIEVMLDLAGPKIRLGEMDAPIMLQLHQKINLIFKNDFNSDEVYSILTLPTNVDLSSSLEEGQFLMIDDGKVKLKVLEIADKLIKCETIVGGRINANKGINVMGKIIPIDFLTPRDQSLMHEVLPKLQPEYILCSFINTADEILRLKTFVQKTLDEANIKNYFPKIVAKIEQQGAIENLDSICKVVDVMMVARGDLALENKFGPVYTPFLQDQIVQVSKENKVPVAIATEMLSSMVSCPIPTRAEASDMYRAVVINKAEYVMMSNETAVGQYPIECIEFVKDMFEWADKTK